MAPSHADIGELRASAQWGSALAGCELGEVADVAVGPDGLVHALGRYPGRVWVLDASGQVRAALGEGLLSPRPHGVTVAADGSIHVVDDPIHAVVVLDADGGVLRTLGTPQQPSDTGVDTSLPLPQWAATVRRGAGPFNHPTKVALGPAGDVFVADGYGNARIHRFTADGELAASWGEPGTGPGAFMCPHWVHVTAAGEVVVADRENDRLQVFTPDGAFVREHTQVQRPTAVVDDPQGRWWVSELPWLTGQVSHRRGEIPEDEPPGVRLLDAGGDVRGRWTQLGDRVPLVAPHGVAVGADGALYVAEVSYSLTGAIHERTLHRCAIA